MATGRIKITSPKNNKFKTYLVETQEPITDESLEALREGVQLHNEKALTRPAKAEHLANTAYVYLFVKVNTTKLSAC